SAGDLTSGEPIDASSADESTDGSNTRLDAGSPGPTNLDSGIRDTDTGRDSTSLDTGPGDNEPRLDSGTRDAGEQDSADADGTCDDAIDTTGCVDTNVDVCSEDNGGCDRLSMCSNTSTGAQCGSCP